MISWDGDPAAGRHFDRMPGGAALVEALVTSMEAAVQTVRTAPLIGLIAEIALLAALAHSVGLSVTGWSVGIVCAITTNAILARALARSRAIAFGPANWVTLARSTFVAGIAALVAEGFGRSVSVAAIVLLTVIALVLDGVDGRVARRTASATTVGARFDMEVDAFLILILSAHVAQSVGLWVLTIGVARYAFAAAGWLLPWLRQAPPARYWYKFVAALQGIVLTIVMADILPGPVNVAVLTLALVLLGESFGHEVWWLWQHGRIRPRRTVGAPRIMLVPAEARAVVGVSE